MLFQAGVDVRRQAGLSVLTVLWLLKIQRYSAGYQDGQYFNLRERLAQTIKGSYRRFTNLGLSVKHVANDRLAAPGGDGIRLLSCTVQAGCVR